MFYWNLFKIKIKNLYYNHSHLVSLGQAENRYHTRVPEIKLLFCDILL